jgi:cation transport regulator ChaC
VTTGSSPDKVQLRGGQVALFGYGSLFSLPSMERSLGRSYNGPCPVCILDGWRRTWDIAVPNTVFFAERAAGRIYPAHILYLNVKRSPGTRVNGVLFVLEPHELGAFDRREWVYDRVDVTGDLRGIEISGGQCFAYVGKPEHVLTDVHSIEVASIRRTYLDILESGLDRLGDGFRREYERSTQPLPGNLVINDQRSDR